MKIGGSHSRIHDISPMALLGALSSFTSPNQQLITNHQLQVCQARCIIHFLSTRKKWKVFFAPLYASKYHKQQISTMFTNFRFVQKNNNDVYIYIYHTVNTYVSVYVWYHYDIVYIIIKKSINFLDFLDKASSSMSHTTQLTQLSSLLPSQLMSLSQWASP